jgi:hypothetical protein
MKTLYNLELTEIQHNENYLLVINHATSFTPDMILGTGKELIDFIFENEEFNDNEINLSEIEKLEIVVEKRYDEPYPLAQLSLFKVK